MSRRLIPYFLILFTSSILLSACGVYNIDQGTASCSNISITYFVDKASDTYTFTAYAGNNTSGPVIGSVTQTNPPYNTHQTVNIPLNPVQQPGSTITVKEESYYNDGSLTLACASQGVTWFNPGDGRIDGQPGDRIAGYCNITSNILTVYGVKDDSNGIFLANFNYDDLVKAGAKGIFVDTHGNGVVSVSVDNQQNFWMAWNGGPYGADGTPKNGFAKGIHCAFTS